MAVCYRLKNLYRYQKILLLLAAVMSLVSCKKDISARDSDSASQIATLLDSAGTASLPLARREAYLDTVYSELADKKNDTLTRYFYRKTASTYYNIERYDKSIIVGRKIANLAREAKDTATLARAYYYNADSFYGKSESDSAFFYYTQAEKLYSDLRDYSALGEVLLYKAYIYYNIGLYDLCESEAIKAIKLLQNRDSKIHIYNCYNLIATALDGQNRNEKALEYFDLALEELNRFKEEGYTDDEIMLYRASCYNNKGLVYSKMKRFDEAISLYNEALAVKGVKNEEALYAKLINNLAYAKFKSGDNSRLPGLFFESLKIRSKLKNKSGIVTSKLHLGEYYAGAGDTAKALGYLRQAYKSALEIESYSDINLSLDLLTRVDNKKRDYYYRRAMDTRDSLSNISKENKDYFARIEYETDKLQTEKDALVKKNSFIIGVSAVILLFIAAVFIIYYLNTKNKELLLIQEQQKANEELYQLMFEQQSKIEKARSEEKNRIAMELHDGILNNIYAVRLNLEFINKKADDESILQRKQFIKELQNVETEIRGVSHDLSRGAVFKEEKSFQTLLEFLIDSQKNNFDTVFDIDIDPDINWEEVSNLLKINLYRIVQEGIRNINKYSQAKEASVSLEKQGDSVKLTISDNGIGFDPESAKGGIGIRNFKKRAALLNGTIAIKSSVGRGTVIEGVFPLAE